MSLSTGEYLAGFAYLVVTLGAFAAAGALLVRRRAPHLRGLTRLLGGFLGFSAALVLAHLLPGLLGLLSRPAVLATALLLVVAAARIPGVAAGAADPAPAEAADPPWSRRTAVLVAAAAAATVIGHLARNADQPVTGVDAMTMYLPMAARWIQNGSIWELAQFAPGWASTNYPHNGVLAMIAGVLPWHSTFAVRYVDVPFLSAMALGVFACARELGAPRSTATLAATATAVMPTVAQVSVEMAQVDTPMWAWFAVGGLFLLRSRRRPESSELLLAGIGLGLAFGTKWYGVAYVPVLVALWAVARLRSHRGLRAALRPLVPLLAPIAGLGCVWLARNWVLTGNPVYPAPVRGFGVTVFDAPVNRFIASYDFTVSDYLFDPGIWRNWYAPGYYASFGLTGPLLLVAGAASAVAVLRARSGAAALVLAAALLIGLFYVRLPFGAWGPEGQPVLLAANARYLVPALLCAAALAAWLAAVRPRWRYAIEALVAVGILESLWRWGWPNGPRALGFGAVVVAAGLGASQMTWRRPPRAVAGVACLAAAAAAGAALPDSGGPEGYRRAEPPIAVLLERLPEGGSVALADSWDTLGLSPVLPAFGPRLRNRVDPLGRFVEGTAQLWREREPAQRQLRRGDYDAVLVGTGAPARPGGEEPEATWVRELGYREVARSPRLVLFMR